MVEEEEQCGGGGGLNQVNQDFLETMVHPGSGSVGPEQGEGGGGTQGGLVKMDMVARKKTTLDSNIMDLGSQDLVVAVALALDLWEELLVVLAVLAAAGYQNNRQPILMD